MDIDELKDFLWCFCHPLAPQQRCVDPKVYEGATSTKDILKNLCPEYVNPVKLFVLEGIVETFGFSKIIQTNLIASIVPRVCNTYLFSHCTLC